MKTDKEWIVLWNKMHIEHCKKGGAIRNNIMADYCEEMILAAKKAYYGSSEVIMSDTRYDWFEDTLKLLRPDSNILEKVGD